MPRDRAQHRVHQAARAPFARPSREIDRIVDDRGGGHAGQVEELVGAEAKNLEHFAIEPLGRPLGKVRDQVVEGGSPAAGRRWRFRRPAPCPDRRAAWCAWRRAHRRGRRGPPPPPTGSRRRRREPARSWVRRQDLAGGEGMTGEKLARGHRPPALGLDPGDGERPFAGGQLQPIARGVENGPRRNGVGQAK